MIDNDYIGLRIGYFDIESTDLMPEHGSILCASVADAFGEVITFRRDAYEQVHPMDDSQLSVAIREFMEDEFDIVVTWFGRQFDIPFINKRLLAAGNELIYEPRMHIDGFDLIEKGSMSRSLDNVSKHFGEQDEEVHKTPFNKSIWSRANAGDEEAMKYVVDHCEQDVLLLRRTMKHLFPRVKRIHK